MQEAQNFIDERLLLSRLLHHKVSTAFLCDLNESVTSHILYTLMGFVHELEEFVDDSFQELPMRLKESRVLTDDVHNVGGNDSFVILSALDLTKSQQIFDNSHQEAFLGFLIWSPGKEIRADITSEWLRHFTHCTRY
jgi:hypothetical protein